MTKEKIQFYYNQILPNNPYHSDNKVKCVHHLLSFMNCHQDQKPDIIIIDEIFNKDFKEYFADSNFFEAFQGVKFLVVERCGKTQFESYKLAGK